MKMNIWFLMTAAVFMLTGCVSGGQIMDGDGMFRQPAYTQISQAEAADMMAKDDGHIVVDVRREDEFASGHIPGAICIPNESIGDTRPPELPDLDQIILIYCRSGNRSKQAAQKLADLGYTHVYEFGGILDWKGDVATEDGAKTASLSFESFDGGGPTYEAEIADLSVVSCERSVRYARADHEQMTGAGYTVTLTFRGLKPGETTVTVRARSPIAENFDALYAVTVDETLSVTLKELSVTDPSAVVRPSAVLVIETESRILYATLTETGAASALLDRLSSDPLELTLRDNGGFEKVGPLPWSLPQSDERMTAAAGDIVLYQGNQLCLFYGENTWSYTPLATLPYTADELKEALGSGDATVTLRLEWSE